MADGENDDELEAPYCAGFAAAAVDDVGWVDVPRWCKGIVERWSWQNARAERHHPRWAADLAYPRVVV